MISVTSTGTGLALGCLVLATACGSPATPTRTTAPSPSATASSATPRAAPPLRIRAKNTLIGPILLDDSGQALYLLDRDRAGDRECAARCAADWPPVLAPAVAGPGVDQTLLGTTKRTDGRIQVSYNGHPLHHLAGAYPEEVHGHGVRRHGGTWLAVRPDGRPAPAGLIDH